MTNKNSSMWLFTRRNPCYFHMIPTFHRDLELQFMLSSASNDRTYQLTSRSCWPPVVVSEDHWPLCGRVSRLTLVEGGEKYNFPCMACWYIREELASTPVLFPLSPLCFLSSMTTQHQKSGRNQEFWWSIQSILNISTEQMIQNLYSQLAPVPCI